MVWSSVRLSSSFLFSKALRNISLKLSQRSFCTGHRHIICINVKSDFVFEFSKRSRLFSTQIELEEKYAERIKQRALREGISVEELKAQTKEKLIKDAQARKVKELEESKNRIENNTNLDNSDSSSSNTNIRKVSTINSSSDNLIKDTTASTSSGPFKPLKDIVNLELLQIETAENITNIWNQFYATKEGYVSGVMELKFYTKLHERAKSFPLFILPLPKEQGFEFYLLQISGPQIYFTSLLEYKTHGSNARPHLVLTHYTELKEKDIVLMMGEIDITATGHLSLTGQEAQYLAYMVQMFYVTGGDKKLSLVEKFHKDPVNFDHQELMSEIENIQ